MIDAGVYLRDESIVLVIVGVVGEMSMLMLIAFLSLRLEAMRSAARHASTLLLSPSFHCSSISRSGDQQKIVGIRRGKRTNFDLGFPISPRLVHHIGAPLFCAAVYCQRKHYRMTSIYRCNRNGKLKAECVQP